LTSTISCSIAYRVLTIIGGFPINYSDFNHDVTFQWIINSLKNPDFSHVTSAFNGQISDTNSLPICYFSPQSGTGITITPGTLCIKIVIFRNINEYNSDRSGFNLEIDSDNKPEAQNDKLELGKNSIELAVVNKRI
jgi:hypothetical protein